MTRPRLLCVGEAMIELAPLADGTYRRGFAGDTFNTAWHMAQVLADRATVGFVTQVGRDAMSEKFVEELAADGLRTDVVARSDDRTMGLYLIELEGVERSFHYWRSMSAAKCLANDPKRLRRALSDADMIHFSGITVAILPTSGRRILLDAITTAKADGARISFDPNVRPALWNGLEEARAVLPDFMAVTDIYLPSLEDERTLWGDQSAQMALDRAETIANAEIIVKDGPGAVYLSVGRTRSVHPSPKLDTIRDTTGAGDAFNAGYLAARSMGHDPGRAVRVAQSLASKVLGCPGARAEKATLKDVEIATGF